MSALENLLKKARQTSMSEAERETQRLSFAYGNTHFENDRITRDTVRKAAEELKKPQQPMPQN